MLVIQSVRTVTYGLVRNAKLLGKRENEEGNKQRAGEKIS